MKMRWMSYLVRAVPSWILGEERTGWDLCGSPISCSLFITTYIIIDWILSIDGGGPINLACKDNGNDIILRANDE